MKLIPWAAPCVSGVANSATSVLKGIMDTAPPGAASTSDRTCHPVRRGQICVFGDASRHAACEVCEVCSAGSRHRRRSAGQRAATSQHERFICGTYFDRETKQSNRFWCKATPLRFIHLRRDVRGTARIAACSRSCSRPPTASALRTCTCSRQPSMCQAQKRGRVGTETAMRANGRRKRVHNGNND